MTNKDILRSVIMQQKNLLQHTEETIKRELLDEILKWFGDNRILILTGLRRSGKSTLLKQIMQHKSRYCYANFEDERFIDFRAQDFEQLNEVLIETYGNPAIYFFDEIQNIKNFETFVRRLQDQGKKIVITGSNASLLSKELGTRLTGRYKAFEVYPFSFSEYLKFRKAEPDKTWFYDTGKKVKLVKFFENFITDGGMPEYLKNKDIEYIKTVYENIIYKDIITRYAIRRERLVRELVNIFITNITAQFTYNSLKKTLGLANAITVKEYTTYLGNSYLFFELQKLELSVKKQLIAPKKIYVADTAFSHILSASFLENKGRVLENIVFIELKRKNKEVYYYADKNECDFMVKSGKKVTEALQVCYNLDETNKKREMAGLLEAMEKFNLKEGLILTQEQNDEIKIKGRKIKIVPVFKWLLENS